MLRAVAGEGVGQFCSVQTFTSKSAGHPAPECARTSRVRVRKPTPHVFEQKPHGFQWPITHAGVGEGERLSGVSRAAGPNDQECQVAGSCTAEPAYVDDLALMRRRRKPRRAA